MNTSRQELIDVAATAIDEAPDTSSFSDLVAIARKDGAFDPARHLRFADWSDIDFRGSKLEGFDFTGARLINCSFDGALIAGAVFDGCIVDVARSDTALSPIRTDLSRAMDWRGFFPRRNAGTLLRTDEHLRTGFVFQDLPDTPELVVVPAGTFMMGTSPEEIAALTKEYSEDYGKFDVKWEGPQHPVTIAQPFAVGRFPVTFEEWGVFATDKRRKMPDDRKWGRGRRPVINVSWDDAKAYCYWLSERTGKPYRLLTEAEWEYCCRAGTETRYGFGDGSDWLGEYAWFDGNSDDKTHPVGEKLSNGFGLHDMHGNVWEWCEDTFFEGYEETPDDGTAEQGKSFWRVLRGGSWDNNPRGHRAAQRKNHMPDNHNGILGFRLARTLIP